jgi:hypothetical protein
MKEVLNAFYMNPEQWKILNKAYAPSTIKQYAKAIYDGLRRTGAAIPVVTTADLQATFWPLCGLPLSIPNTLRQALIAFQAVADLPPPPFDSQKGHIIFRALKNDAPSTATPRKLPLSKDMIFNIFNFWASWHTRAAQRNAAFFALHVATIHRFSELAACTAADLFDLGFPNGFIWIVRKTKTEINGHDVHIPEETGQGFKCAQVLRQFLTFAPTDDNGPIFRPTDRKLDKWGPPFKDNGSLNSLSLGSWNGAFRHAIKCACPNKDAQRFSSHSVRAGGATSLLQQGVPLDVTRLVLHHKSLTAVNAYHKQIPEFEKATLSQLFK